MLTLIAMNENYKLNASRYLFFDKNTFTLFICVMVVVKTSFTTMEYVRYFTVHFDVKISLNDIIRRMFLVIQ